MKTLFIVNEKFWNFPLFFLLFFADFDSAKAYVNGPLKEILSEYPKNKLNELRVNLQSCDITESEWFKTFSFIESHLLKHIGDEKRIQPKITNFFGQQSNNDNNN